MNSIAKTRTCLTGSSGKTSEGPQNLVLILSANLMINNKIVIFSVSNVVRNHDNFIWLKRF